MNPPYSRISEFMEFAYDQHKKNNVSCLILTYSKTGTRWWHRYVQGIADHVEFQKGRISFLDEYGNQTKNTAPYDSAWIVFEKKECIRHAIGEIPQLNDNQKTICNLAGVFRSGAYEILLILKEQSRTILYTNLMSKTTLDRRVICTLSKDVKAECFDQGKL